VCLDVEGETVKGCKAKGYIVKRWNVTLESKHNSPASIGPAIEQCIRCAIICERWALYTGIFCIREMHVVSHGTWQETRRPAANINQTQRMAGITNRTAYQIDQLATCTSTISPAYPGL
jgi:hypothetical protein